MTSTFRRFAFAAALLAPAAQALDLGVSVGIGDPNFYGRIDIGDFPRPQLIFPQPVIIQPVPVGVVRGPMYLRVPPGHEKHWDKHCAQYNACGYPVYFVRDDWYSDVYAPEYKAKHGKPHDGDGPGNSGKSKGNSGKGHGHH